MMDATGCKASATSQLLMESSHEWGCNACLGCCCSITCSTRRDLPKQIVIVVRFQLQVADGEAHGCLWLVWPLLPQEQQSARQRNLCGFAVKVYSEPFRACSQYTDTAHQRLAPWGDPAGPITITLVERSSLCFQLPRVLGAG